MEAKKILYYKVVKDEYVFYYDRYIIFKNSKTNPFIFINVEKEGATKQLPLYYCDVFKFGTNGFKIKFYNNASTVNLTINCVKEKIIFRFEKHGLSGEKTYFNFYKKQAKITGLGLNKRKDLNKIYTDIYMNNQRKIGAYDTKLDFSVKGSYFFKNNGIDEWDVYFGNTVRIGTRQSNGTFTMEFNKNFEVVDKYNYCFRVVKPEEIEKYSQKGIYNGFITAEEDSRLMRRRIKEVREKGYKYYLLFSPIIKEDSEEFNNYDKNGLIYIGNGNYLVDVSHIENKRAFTNKIRSLLDLNIDGLYIDEISVKIMKSIVIQKAIIYKNLTEIINTVSEEYPEKVNIYNKFNSSEKHVGIYSCNYSAIKRKENRYIKALRFSAVDSVFYECRERELKKLQKKEKKQIIVKNKKWFIFDDFLLKKPKIKHFKNQ